MGRKVIEGSLNINGRLLQNGEEVRVFLEDYSSDDANGATITGITAGVIGVSAVTIIRDITGWPLKEAKNFVDSLTIGTNLTFHSYGDLQLTDEQIVEFVSQATEKNLMTFAGAATGPLQKITIVADKKAIIFNDNTELNIVQNIQDSEATNNGIQMRQDSATGDGTFDFTGKNPNATIIDDELTGEIPYGAIGEFATSVGGKSAALGKRSMSQGTTTIAVGKYSHAEGDNSVAYGNDSHAEGYATVAEGDASHSEGDSTQTHGKGSHAEGYSTTASGEFSHAEGHQSTASGKGAHATGNVTSASGQYSTTAGSGTVAGYSDQFAVGRFNTNQGWNLFEVGKGQNNENRSNAFTVSSFGYATVDNVGSGDGKNVVNIQFLTERMTALKEHYDESIGLVYSSVPTNLKNGGAQNSVQGGADSVASYSGDFVFGTGLRNTRESQAVFGSYNKNDDYYYNTLLVVGNGENDSSRNNAFAVFGDGHAEVQTAGTTDNSVVRRADLNNLDSLKIIKPDNLNNLATSITHGNEGVVLTTNTSSGTSFPFAAFTIKNGDGSEDSTYPSGYLSIEVGPGRGKDGRSNCITLNAGAGTTFNKSYYSLPSNVGTKGNPAIIATEEYVDNTISNLNIENGTGKGSLLQKDKTSFVFENPNSDRNGETITVDATGEYATSLGGSARAEGKRSVAEGTSTIAQGPYSHAEGNKTITTAADAHAEGLQTVASGVAAHSEGELTVASGQASHAEGKDTEAGALGAHAEGVQTNAVGAYSHAGGYLAGAHGAGSFAHGRSVSATHDYQIALGQRNEDKENTVLEIGWSEAEGVKRNVFEVYKDGSIGIGNTILTEQQLIKLLALLDAMETVTETE